MPNELEQLPTDPGQQRAAVLQSLFPQNPQANAGAPPVAGAQPPQSPDIMSEMIQASRQGRGIATGEAGKVGGLGSQIEGLVQQQQQTPIPKTGFLDTQGQPQQGGFLHNLGRALIAVGTATRPGQAIQEAYYGPGVRRYEAETGARAKEIEQLHTQQEEHEKLAGVGAGMVSKPITAAAQVGRSEAMQQRAEAYSQKVQNDLRMGLRGLDLKALRTGTQMELDKARAVLDRVIAQQAPERTAIAKEGVELGAYTRQAIAQVETELGMQKEHPLLTMFDSLTGTSLTPASPRVGAPGGPGVTVPPTRPTAKSTAQAVSGSVAKGTHVWDPNGVEHTADGTHPLPKGWSTKKPGA